MIVTSNEEKYGTGWRPDFPDFRDFSLNTFHLQKDIDGSGKEQQRRSNMPNNENALYFELQEKNPPPKMDLREYCSEVRNQKELGACTAFAGISIIEYYEKRSKGSYIPASPLFLYKATRNYMKLQGDTGADPRGTMAAIVLFGVPPEKYLEYNPGNFDVEPPSFLYSFAQNFKSVKFFRHDTQSMKDSNEVLKSIRLGLANGIPAMCGFTLFGSWEQSNSKLNGERGMIPFPSRYDSRAGGHSIAVFGYDDDLEIMNRADTSVRTKGAFLIKNSWGKDWGEDGYGWLPYEYLYKGLCIDWWSIIKFDWVDTDAFKDITPNLI